MKININLEDLLTKYIYSKFPNKYNFTYHTQKYKLNDIVKDTLYMLKTGLSYRDIRSNVNYKSLHKHILFFRKHNIFQKFYVYLLKRYFNNNKTGKLKYQLVDTSYIYNMYGVGKIGRNKFYKGKRGYKLSFITDMTGIPISVLIKSGEVADSKLIQNHMNNMLVIANTNKYKNNNRFKQYLLADAGYDEKEFREIAESYSYQCIIPYNKRNTKDPLKIKKLTEKEKIKYKKRIKIENCFAWIKKNKRLKNIYDKNKGTYESFLFLGLIKLIHKRLKK